MEAVASAMRMGMQHSFFPFFCQVVSRVCQLVLNCSPVSYPEKNKVYPIYKGSVGKNMSCIKVDKMLKGKWRKFSFQNTYGWMRSQSWKNPQLNIATVTLANGYLQALYHDKLFTVLNLIVFYEMTTDITSI